MAAGVIPVRVGDVDLLIETTPTAGTEATSRATDAAERIEEAFERMQQAVLELASSTRETIAEAGRRGARPDQLEVEFGLGVSASGRVLVAGASAEATLRVKLTYIASPD